MKRLLIGATAAMALCACATAVAAPPPAAGETSIPYANRDGIIDWKVAGKDALYIQGMSGGWFYVRTMGLCPRLRTANALGFVTSAGGQLDRYSAILAEGMRCQVASVRRSEPPPPALRGRKRG
jgi:hypothetical protein